MPLNPPNVVATPRHHRVEYAAPAHPVRDPKWFVSKTPATRASPPPPSDEASLRRARQLHRSVCPIVFLIFFPLFAVATQSARLSWLASSSPEVVGYNIYYGTESGLYSTLISVTDTTTEIPDLEDGAKYYFAVRAYDSSGVESDFSNEAAYNVPGIAPPRDAPFIAQMLPSNSITLGWTPSPSGDVQGYFVRSGTQSGVYDNLVWVAGASEMDIFSLVEGLTYYFAVSAVDSLGTESALSPELSYGIPQVSPPQYAPFVQQLLPEAVATLSWSASPSADVAGYRVYYGTLSGVYENWVEAGWTEGMDIGGLVPGQMYYFAVVAYNASGQESLASLETYCFIQDVAGVVPPQVLLSLQPIPTGAFASAFAITATGPIPPSWTLEGSPDLKTWHTLVTGGESEINVTVAIAEKPAMFFRLNSGSEGITLEMQTGGTYQYPHSFVVTTPDYVPGDWTLTSSEDLENWLPLTTGYSTPVKAVIVNSSTPAMYFRLKGD